MKITTQQVTVALSVLLIVIIGLYFIVRQSVDSKNRDTITQLDSVILEQEKQLLVLSELTRTNGGDELTNKIIVDCSPQERVRFDKLLDLLSGTISANELTELNTLFYRCGSFYADRKSVMATRLLREVEILSSYFELQNILHTSTQDYSKKISVWEQLASAELQSAEYFNQLVLLQGTIISELKSGKQTTAPEIASALKDVNSVRGKMVVLSKQIEVYKAEVASL